MDKTSRILAQVDGTIGTLTFNKPERHNAVSLEMWRDAATVLEQFATSPDVRVVVLTGAGSKAFVSGADISKFESERGSKEAVAVYGAAVEHLQQILFNHPKPTVAMIRGYCVGGGVNIAIACDMRICNESSRFGILTASLERPESARRSVRQHDHPETHCSNRRKPGRADRPARSPRPTIHWSRTGSSPRRMPRGASAVMSPIALTSSVAVILKEQGIPPGGARSKSA